MTHGTEDEDTRPHLTVLRLGDELRQAHDQFGILIGERDDLAAELARARERLEHLREVAVAFAFVAVSAEPTLRSARTLELLRERCNECRPPDAAALKPGLWP